MAFPQVARTLALAVAVIVAATLGEWYVATVNASRNVRCEPPAEITRLDHVREASGLALGSREPGVLWTHNDSGPPVLFAVDAGGTRSGQLRLDGATVEDWEDVSIGPCGRAGSCLYVADIGDNGRQRATITVYRVPEPSLGEATATVRADRFVGRYPDGPHDAEAFFVTSEGRMFVVTKDQPAKLYAFPQNTPEGSTLPLGQVGTLPLDGVTGADVSSDGRWVVVRTSEQMLFYSTEALIAGMIPEGLGFDLRGVGEPQGEGIDMAADGTVYLASEGGSGGRAGIITSLRCKLAR